MSIERFLQDSGARVPLICGAMYPSSTPELVRHVGLAGGLGMIQPTSFTYVHGWDFEEALRFIRGSEGLAYGINILLESSSEKHLLRNLDWLRLALENDCRFVVTALGKPGRVLDVAHSYGAKVYHKVTTLRHAEVAASEGIDGLIAVNNRAGGHVGDLSPEEMLRVLKSFGVPVVAAGGCGSAQQFADLLEMGYSGVLAGTRFVASAECGADPAWKQAIVDADESAVVRTDRITGVPLSVLQCDQTLITAEYVRRFGLQSSGLARWLLRHPKTKRWMRAWYSWRSGRSLKRAMNEGFSTKDVYQAGKSVAGITKVETVEEIVASFEAAARGRGVL